MDAASIAAGKAVTKSAKRTPSGASSRQRPGKSSIGAILPTHRPFSQPTPVVILTFFSSDQLATWNTRQHGTLHCMGNVGNKSYQGVISATYPVTEVEDTKKIRILTFAFAFLYALVHACVKSGTSAGFSTGGGCLGEVFGYTPGMGG